MVVSERLHLGRPEAGHGFDAPFAEGGTNLLEWKSVPPYSPKAETFPIEREEAEPGDARQRLTLPLTDDAHHRPQNGILLSWHIARGDRIQHPLEAR